jgi:urease accessory protein
MCPPKIAGEKLQLGARLIGARRWSKNNRELWIVLRLRGILGSESDAQLRHQLHELEHLNAIEHLFVPEADIGRRRLRLTTDKGTDCAIELRRTESLANGSVLFLDKDRAITVRIGVPKCLRFRARTQQAALQLGWNAGNLHWRVRFEGEDLVVLLDGPREEYIARIAFLLSKGGVEEVDVCDSGGHE